MQAISWRYEADTPKTTLTVEVATEEITSTPSIATRRMIMARNGHSNLPLYTAFRMRSGVLRANGMECVETRGFILI